MAIDAARHHQQAAGIDDVGAVTQIDAHGGDPTVADAYVGPDRIRSGDDGAAPNDSIEHQRVLVRRSLRSDDRPTLARPPGKA